MKVPPMSEAMVESAGGSSSSTEADFSEYLWMENEEEFDKEVMRQLEEEALMEQCIQAMLEDEQEGQLPPDSITPRIDSLSLSDPDILQNSKLNPNAPEFIPRTNSPVV